MGWASGFRAGSDMAQGWLDTYNEAKQRRDIRELEKGLQAQQTERQAAQGGYAAEQQRLAGMTQPQFAAQQVGLGPAPMGSAQMSPVTAPPSAPVQPSLVNPQQAAAGISLPGQMAPEPGTYSPVSGQALGLGAAPQAPMSAAQMEMERANQLRGLGYTDEADKAYNRAMALREEARDIEQTEFSRGIATREEARADRRLTMAEENAALTQELTGLRIDAAGMELQEKRDIKSAYDAYQNYDGPIGQFYETPEWNKLSMQGKQAIVTSATGIEAGLQDLGSMRLENELNKAQTLDDMAGVVSRDKAITPDAAVRIERDEDTGKVSIVYFNDNVADEQNYTKELFRREFPTEEAAMENFKASAMNPALGAAAYEDSRLAAQAVAFDKALEVINTQSSIAELEAAVLEKLLGDFGISSLDSMTAQQRAAVDREVDRIIDPLRSSLSRFGVNTGTGRGLNVQDNVFAD